MGNWKWVFSYSWVVGAYSDDVIFFSSDWKNWILAKKSSQKVWNSGRILRNFPTKCAMLSSTTFSGWLLRLPELLLSPIPLWIASSYSICSIPGTGGRHVTPMKYVVSSWFPRVRWSSRNRLCSPRLTGRRKTPSWFILLASYDDVQGWVFAITSCQRLVWRHVHMCGQGVVTLIT